MSGLLKIVGVLWALLGAGNILVSPEFREPGGGFGGFVIIFNFVLFILPGLGVYGIGAMLGRKKSPPGETLAMMVERKAGNDTPAKADPGWERANLGEDILLTRVGNDPPSYNAETVNGFLCTIDGDTAKLIAFRERMHGKPIARINGLSGFPHQIDLVVRFSPEKTA